MRTILRCALVAALPLLALVAGAPALSQDPAPAPAETSPADHDASGHWQGAIEVPGTELAIIVHLSHKAGAWSGTIDIPAQGLKGFVLADVEVEGSAVGFAMDGVPGRPTFAGTLAESGEAIAGDFTQGGQELSFFLNRAPAGAEASPGEATAAIDEDWVPMPGDGPVGIWVGALDVGPMTLRLVLEVEEAADGEGLAATFDSVDQGAKFPVDRIAFADGELTFGIDGIGGSFTGTMNGDGSAVEGTWTQGGRSWYRPGT